MKKKVLTQRQRGDIGENQAVEFLEKLGYRILQQNFYIRGGEIDIIAKDGDVLVFVEVKTRYNRSFGTPEESISRKKIQCIQRSIVLYLHQKQLSEFDIDFRIDVIAINRKDNGTNTVSEIRHYKDAFTFDDFL